MPLPRKLLVLMAVAGLSLAGCEAFEVAAAVVDDRKIDDDRFQKTVEFVLAGPQFSQLPPGEESEEQRRNVVRQLLTFLIHQELVEAEAADREISVPDEEVDALLEAQIEQLGGDRSFRQQLERSGMTVPDVEDLLRSQLVRERVAQAVVTDLISEEELRAEYEQRLAEFTTVDVAHILVESRGQARRIAAQGTPGNFGRLARRFSQDPGSARSGGELGSRPASDFVGPFADAVLQAPVGEVTGPVRTEFGFHVILVLDRQVTSFDQVSEQLVQARSGQVFSEWLLERAREVLIRVNPRYGVYSEQEGQVIPRTSTTPLPGPQVTP